MPIHEVGTRHIIATGVYHAMEVKSIEDTPTSNLMIEGIPSEGRYEPAVDFIFKTPGHPSAIFGRRDIVAIYEWLGKWLEDNPTPENIRMYTPEWQRTPDQFVR